MVGRSVCVYERVCVCMSVSVSVCAVAATIYTSIRAECAITIGAGVSCDVSPRVVHGACVGMCHHLQPLSVVHECIFIVMCTCHN